MQEPEDAETGIFESLDGVLELLFVNLIDVSLGFIRQRENAVNFIRGTVKNTAFFVGAEFPG